MKIIVCVDDNLGILFNNRRVSKDKKIIEDIESFVTTISMNEYSSKLFTKEVIITDELTENFNFVETKSLKGLEEKIDELIIYYFNRKYPSDLKLQLNLNFYEVLAEEEFEGNSHDKITKKIYRRVV